MKQILQLTSFSVVIVTASVALAAGTPFAGTWKLNLDKSKLTGDTIKFASAGEMIRVTGGGDSYEFKPDGSEAKARFGIAMWKKIDDKTWEEADMVKGRLDAKSTWTLSDDGKTLTQHVTGDKPGGGSFDDTVTYIRIAGTKGFLGTWKDKNVKSSAPSTLTLSDLENGLMLEEPDFKLKAKAHFDGKPGDVEGPTIPEGASFTMKKTSARSFRMLRTQDGKPFDTATWTVSPDGKTMTVVSHVAGTTDAPTTEVFEKQ